MNYRRRKIVLALAASALPATISRAQQPQVRLVGFLSARSASDSEGLVAVFREALREAGYLEGKNLRIEYRWAEGRFERLDALASDLVARKVEVLATTGGNAAALAAKKATSTIPVVFGAGGDPVKLGLVASLSRPGGNVTGASQLTEALEAKRVELIRDLMPRATRIGVLINRRNPASAISIREVTAAAKVLERSVNFSSAGSATEIEAAFTAMATRRTQALIVTTDPFLDTQRDRVITLAARNRLPAVYGWREHAVAGGLASYGSAATESYRTVGRYVGRILGGARPGDLPIQASKISMVINLRTARSLGIAIPQGLLVRADEVIE